MSIRSGVGAAVALERSFLTCIILVSYMKNQDTTICSSRYRYNCRRYGRNAPHAHKYNAIFDTIFYPLTTASLITHSDRHSYKPGETGTVTLRDAILVLVGRGKVLCALCGGSAFTAWVDGECRGAVDRPLLSARTLRHHFSFGIPASTRSQQPSPVARNHMLSI